MNSVCDPLTGHIMYNGCERFADVCTWNPKWQCFRVYISPKSSVCYLYINILFIHYAIYMSWNLEWGPLNAYVKVVYIQITNYKLSCIIIVLFKIFSSVQLQRDGSVYLKRSFTLEHEYFCWLYLASTYTSNYYNNKLCL